MDDDSVGGNLDLWVGVCMKYTLAGVGLDCSWGVCYHSRIIIEEISISGIVVVVLMLLSASAPRHVSMFVHDLVSLKLQVYQVFPFSEFSRYLEASACCDIGTDFRSWRAGSKC